MLEVRPIIKTLQKKIYNYKVGYVSQYLLDNHTMFFFDNT